MESEDKTHEFVVVVPLKVAKRGAGLLVRLVDVVEDEALCEQHVARRSSDDDLEMVRDVVLNGVTIQHEICAAAAAPRHGLLDGTHKLTNAVGNPGEGLGPQRHEMTVLILVKTVFPIIHLLLQGTSIDGADPEVTMVTAITQ